MTPTSDAATTAPAHPPGPFPFGRNWQDYVSRYLDPEREASAQRSLETLFETKLTGKTFLDIGSGSGLFSLSAYRLGAAKVVSLDVDGDSVAACERLRQAAGCPSEWTVLQGSILDPDTVVALEPADIVYSWGVLHHTGDMWAALSAAGSLVRPEGLFAIAIYNRVTGHWLDSERWLGIKKAYNRAPLMGKRLMEGAFIAHWSLGTLKERKNPWLEARRDRGRGMAMITDVRDWLGGYPYEYATSDEIAEFCERWLGMRARKVIDVGARGYGNNEFVFERTREVA